MGVSASKQKIVFANGVHRQACVVVSGCETELGKQVVLACAANKLHVFAVCEHKDTVWKLTSKVTDGRIVPIVVNMSLPKGSLQLASAMKEHLQEHHYVWGIVHTPARGIPGNSDLLDIDAFKQVMQAGLYSVVEMNHVVLPLLKKSQGRVISMVSMDAKHPLPGYATSSAANGALSGYTDSLRMEMMQWGVKVVEVQVSCAPVQPAPHDSSTQASAEYWWKQYFKTASKGDSQSYGENYIHKQAVQWAQGLERFNKNYQKAAEAAVTALTVMNPKHRIKVIPFKDIVKSSISLTLEEEQTQLSAFFMPVKPAAVLSNSREMLSLNTRGHHLIKLPSNKEGLSAEDLLPTKLMATSHVGDDAGRAPKVPHEHQQWGRATSLNTSQATRFASEGNSPDYRTHRKHSLTRGMTDSMRERFLMQDDGIATDCSLHQLAFHKNGSSNSMSKAALYQRPRFMSAPGGGDASISSAHVDLDLNLPEGLKLAGLRRSTSAVSMDNPGGSRARVKFGTPRRRPSEVDCPQLSGGTPPGSSPNFTHTQSSKSKLDNISPASDEQRAQQRRSQHTVSPDSFASGMTLDVVSG